MTLTKKILISIVFFVAIFIRLIKLDLLPLFGDEVDVGYQSYSLMSTFKDYKGNFLPVYIQSFSESRAPLLMYVSIPFVKFFGLNEYGVRMSSVFFGILAIFILYLLVYFLSKSFWLSFWFIVFLAFNPWSFHYNRTAFEVSLLLFLIASGTYFFYRYLEKRKLIFNILFILSFSLSFYTYNTANIFVPLIALFLVFSERKKIFKDKKIGFYFFNFFLILVLVFPIIKNTLWGSAANRFSLINIFNDQNTISEIIFKRTSFSSSLSKTESFFHNKPIEWTKSFFFNYFESISPSFLFFKGDTNPRHSVPGFGLLLMPLFFPLLFGLYKFNPKDKLNKLMLFWFLIAPIASSLTVDGGHHPTRLFLLFPPLCFFIAQGIVFFKKFFVLIILLCSFVNLTLYFHEYFIHFPKENFENWQFGYKELIQSVPRQYNRLFVSNANYVSLPQFLFYSKYSPKDFLVNFHGDTEIKNFYSDLNGFNLDSKILFVNNWNSEDKLQEINKIAQKGDVFVLFQLKDIPGDWNFEKNPLEGFNTIKVVNFPNSLIFGQVIQKK